MTTTITLTRRTEESNISALFSKFRREDNTYYLKGLQTYVTLDKKQFIRDAGFVPNIVEHTKEILEEIGLTSDNEYLFSNLKLNPFWKDSYKSGGSFFMYKFDNGFIEIVLRYIRDTDPISNLIAKGHEETHAADALDKPILEHLIARFGYDSTNIKGLHPEARCQIGGLMALKIRGISLYHNMKSIFNSLDSNYRKWTEEAFEILS
tara:strand:- start:400 stop:1020 length:621 start_codon:yes stop_codon:yes gene_type:complete